MRCPAKVVRQHTCTRWKLGVHGDCVCVRAFLSVRERGGKEREKREKECVSRGREGEAQVF